MIRRHNIKIVRFHTQVFFSLSFSPFVFFSFFMLLSLPICIPSLLLCFYFMWFTRWMTSIYDREGVAQEQVGKTGGEKKRNIFLGYWLPSLNSTLCGNGCCLSEQQTWGKGPCASASTGATAAESQVPALN